MTRKGTSHFCKVQKNWKVFCSKTIGKEHFELWLAKKFFLALYQKKKPHFLFKPHQIGQGEKKGNLLIKEIVHPHSFQETLLLLLLFYFWGVLERVPSKPLNHKGTLREE
jgi:hypothetical protein